MTSNTLPTSNITELDFSEDEKNALKKHITEKIQGLKVESPMSIGLFFNTIELLGVGSVPYTLDNIGLWNTWVQGQKESCIKTSRANATAMPKIYHNKLRDFFNTLTFLGILDANEDIIKNVQDAVNSVLTKNPTH